MQDTLSRFTRQVPLQRTFAWGLILLAALFAFELFNFSTTEFALHDLLGSLAFAGLPWATILAIAFCGIDFAGIARLFSPDPDPGAQPNEVWYLFGAWLLAATMNAVLTWWGVSIAILHHDTLGNAVVDRSTLLQIVPIFVAVMVWLIRVLIIGTFSVAGPRLFSLSPQPAARTARRPARTVRRPASAAAAFRPAPKPRPEPHNTPASPRPRPEPTYHPILAARPNGGSRQKRERTAH